jgi:tRNA G18 (ribose-2'-O)-methylase SpoU
MLMARNIILVAHNLRSTHNVGSLFRTAEGLGVNVVYLTGYTPYPLYTNDVRLPHLAQKINRQIQKTALGAEKLVNWHYQEGVMDVIEELRRQGYMLYALEQSPSAIPLTKCQPTQNLAVIVGREVEGIEQEILHTVDEIVEIPMLGKKESFNVVQAAAMALFYLRHCS